MLPTKERCLEVLEEPNRYTDPWICPVCGEGPATRAHWIADHALKHHARGMTTEYRGADSLDLAAALLQLDQRESLLGALARRC